MRSIVLALVILTLTATGVSAATSQRPSLRLAGTTPLVVQGAAFRPHEKVQLLVNAGKPFRVAVRAGVRGAFRHAFRYAVPACTAVSVQAFGDRGSRASYSLAQPDCAPIPG